MAIGVKACKNELIARMDSDDISIKERCEKQLKKFQEDPELDLIGSSIAEFIDTTNNVQAYRVLPESDEEIKKFIKRRNPFGHPSVMFKKSKLLEAGNYRSYYLCEDYDMWIRMVEKDAKCYNFKDILVFILSLILLILLIVYLYLFNLFDSISQFVIYASGFST